MYLAGTENYTTVGTPTIVDNVASGFSTSNYLKIEAFDIDVYDKWILNSEIVFKFNFPSIN